MVNFLKKLFQGNSRKREHDSWKHDINVMMSQQNAAWSAKMTTLNASYSNTENRIVNGDFSIPHQTSFSYTTPDYWTKSGNGNVILSNVLSNNQGFVSFGGIQQFLAFQLAEGGDVKITQTIQFPRAGVYIVTFALAARRDFPTVKTLTHPEHQIEIGIDLDDDQYHRHTVPSRNWTVFQDYFFIREDNVNKPTEFRIRSFGARGGDSTVYVGKVSLFKTNICPYYSSTTNTYPSKLRQVFDPTITAFDPTGKIWDSVQRGEYDKEDPTSTRKFRPINNDPVEMNPFPDISGVTTNCYNEWFLKKSGYEYCDYTKQSIRKTNAKPNWEKNTDADADNVKVQNVSECIPINPTHYGITTPIFKDSTKGCEVLGTDIDKKVRIDYSLPITNVFSHNNFAFSKPKCLKVNPTNNDVVLSDCEEKGTNTTDVQLHSVRRIFNVNNNYFYRERTNVDNVVRIVRFEGMDGKGCMYTDSTNNLKYRPICSSGDDPNEKFTYDPSNNTIYQTKGSIRYMTAPGLMTSSHEKLKSAPGNPGVVEDIPMKMESCTAGIRCDSISLDKVDFFNEDEKVKIDIGDQMYRFAGEEDINGGIEGSLAYVGLLKKYDKYVREAKAKYEKEKRNAMAILQESEEEEKFERNKEDKIRNQNQYVIQESYNKILQQTESVRQSSVKETSNSQTERKRTVYKMEHQKTGRVAHQILFVLYFFIMGLFLILLFLKTEMAVMWIFIILLVVLYPFFVLFLEYTIGYLFYYVYYLMKGSASYNVPYTSSFIPAFFYYIYYTLFGKPILHEEVNLDYYTTFQSHGIIPFG